MKRNPLSLLVLCVAATASTVGQWQQVTTSFPYAHHLIFSMDVVNENVVWVASDTISPNSFSGKVLRTTNGGLTWATFSFPGSQSNFILDIDAVDASTAWIAINAENGYSGGIYKTSDGGVTWRLQIASPSVFLHMYDAQHGVSVNSNLVYTTTNGGDKWQFVTDVPPFLRNEFNIVPAGNTTRATYGDTIWVPTSKGRIYRSTDRGYNWIVTQTSLGQSTCITSLAFRDGRNGLLVSSLDSSNHFAANQLARTNDGGMTWTRLTAPSFHSADCIAAVPGMSGGYVMAGGVYAGETSGSAYTTDDGDSWTAIDFLPHNAIAFISPSMGWVGGITGTASGGMFKWAGGSLISIGDPDRVVHEFRLAQNYPNPFNPATVIRFQLPVGATVSLRIYDILGNEVRMLVDEYLDTGSYERTLYAEGLASGIYFYRLQAGGYQETKRLTLLR